MGSRYQTQPILWVQSSTKLTWPNSHFPSFPCFYWLKSSNHHFNPQCWWVNLMKSTKNGCCGKPLPLPIPNAQRHSAGSGKACRVCRKTSRECSTSVLEHGCWALGGYFGCLISSFLGERPKKKYLVEVVGLRCFPKIVEGVWPPRRPMEAFHLPG